MLSNSAAKPNPIADKWFPMPSIPSSILRGTQTPTVSPSLQQLAANLQPKGFAEGPGLQLHGAQQPDVIAVMFDPTDMSAKSPLCC